MATVQESCVFCLRLGRGVGNNAYSTTFGHVANNNGTTIQTTSIGYLAGRYNNTGQNNVFVGFVSGRYAGGGDFNTGFGSHTLRSVYDRQFAVGIGTFANYFYNNRSVAAGGSAIGNVGDRPGAVAIGHYAASSAGEYSVALGFKTAQGMQSDRTVSFTAFAAQNNNQSTKNISGGFYTSRYAGGGGNNIHIGWYAYQHNGYGGWGQSSFGRYTNSTGCVWTGWSNMSDCRDKTNITPLTDNLGINFLRKLRPVKYKWDFRQAYVNKCGYEFGVKDGSLKEDEIAMGFIAQEVDHSAYTEGTKFDAVSYDSFRDFYTMNYLDLVSTLTKALQHINDELDLIETQLQA